LWELIIQWPARHKDGARKAKGAENPTKKGGYSTTTDLRKTVDAAGNGSIISLPRLCFPKQLAEEKLSRAGRGNQSKTAENISKKTSGKSRR